MTAIDVRVYSAADPSNLLAILERTRSRRWTDALSEPGSGSFEVSALHPKLVVDPSIISYGNVVRFAIDDEEVFGFIIESKTNPRISDKEDAGRWIKVAGRGVLALLESAVMYPGPEGGLAGAGERSWMATNAGEIMRELYLEAVGRGALAGMTRDFGAVDDSNGAAFTEILDISERAGTDLLTIALRHADLAVDVNMTPDLVLQYFNTRGVDRTLGPAPVVLRLGDSLRGLTTEGEGVIKNTLLIQGPDSFVDRQDEVSAGIYGRREGFLAVGNAKSGAQLTRAANQTLRYQGVPIESVKLEAAWGSAARPYLDYQVGDYILAPTSDLDKARQRVRSVTIDEDAEGVIRVTPELAYRKKELEARFQRWLKSIGDGSLGGTAAATAVPASPDIGTADAIGAAIALHESTHPHPDELNDLIDVDTAGVHDEDRLAFESTAGQWEPKTGSGGLTASAPWNPPVVTDQHFTSIDVACPGATRGDPATAGFDQLTAGWSIFATVIANNQVRVDLWNRTGATVDLAAGTVHVAVFPA